MMRKASRVVIAMAEKKWKVGRRGREGPAGRELLELWIRSKTMILE